MQKSGLSPGYCRVVGTSGGHVVNRAISDISVRLAILDMAIYRFLIGIVLKEKKHSVAILIDANATRIISKVDFEVNQRV